ncbi:MAG: carboxypeptidase-like regulatory domain-containing protein, partial [Ignavibacteria bacterium]|nr:carboxypeptidase-like regulatory domain-containing protein [Ignavibacteria bacterium]
MKKNSLIVLMNLLLLFTATSLFAQGTIRGVIKDSLTAETLVGANVFLEGTSLGSATDIEGEYRIPRVPEGT